GDLSSPEAIIAIGVLVAMAVVGAFLARRDFAGQRAVERS
ncbi:MAG: hypothetical protein QOD81_2885, partial [Solirubrobacteraceae bacterium]|nr:hypothetical protein [Solirubrobacteraceae bacterium]